MNRSALQVLLAAAPTTVGAQAHGYTANARARGVAAPYWNASAAVEAVRP